MGAHKLYCFKCGKEIADCGYSDPNHSDSRTITATHCDKQQIL